MDGKSMVSAVEEYLAFRHQLGFALHIEGAELRRFARYADKLGHQGPLTTELALKWARLPEHADPLYWARRLDIVRRFAKHRALLEPGTEIPPPGLLGRSYRRPTPHIYTEQEIAALLQAASELGPSGGLRPRTYVTLLGLLACTGLRISEALRLDVQDVDLEAGVLRVRETKFKKSRLVPLHVSTVEALHRYSVRRKLRHPTPAFTTFFVTEYGTSLRYRRTVMTFRSLRRQLGWQVDGHPAAPRIQDMRHTFAVRCLLGWYNEGAEIDRKIAALATYMGHVKVSDTYWYLTAVPELLAVAGSRFERSAGTQLGGGS